MTAMSDFAQDSFDAWLAANAPGGKRTRQPLHPGVASLAAAMSRTPVVIGSALTGANAQQALAADNAYVSAAPADAVARLQQSPATGCTMLLTLAREQSGYDPAVPAQVGSVQAFFSYVNQLLLCPLFSTILNDHITPGFSGGWSSMIDQITGCYEGIPAREIDTLRQSLLTIAAAASSSPSTNETMNMFSQATLNVDADIDVYMYHTFVQMMTTVQQGGKHEPDTVSNQASLSLYRIRLRFDSANWPNQAAQVHQQTQQSLSDWLANNSTPSGSLSADWHPR
jgi:hypothetical protein